MDLIEYSRLFKQRIKEEAIRTKERKDIERAQKKHVNNMKRFKCEERTNIIKLYRNIEHLEDGHLKKYICHTVENIIYEQRQTKLKQKANGFEKKKQRDERNEHKRIQKEHYDEARRKNQILHGKTYYHNTYYIKFENVIQKDDHILFHI
jgi:hypothetical protein